MIGDCHWGLGMDVQQSIIPASVAPIVGLGVRRRLIVCSLVFMESHREFINSLAMVVTVDKVEMRNRRKGRLPCGKDET